MWINDFDREAKLFLVDLSEFSARLRASVILPPETGISFRWMGPSRETILVHGHISDVKMTNPKTAEYSVELSMPLSVRDYLGRELVEMQRRRTAKAFESESPLEGEEDTLFDGDVGMLTKRKFYRALAQFPVRVKMPKRGRVVSLEAEARDLSVGGMMLQLPDVVAEGTELDLAFTLPAHAESPKSKHKEVVEITPFGERRTKKAEGPRAPVAIESRARVLKRLGTARNGEPLFGVAFVELPSYYTEELARWIHAHQIKQLRKTGPSPRRTTNDRPPLLTRKERTSLRPRHVEVARSVLARAIHERRYGPPTFARDTRELIKIPSHYASPVAIEDDRDVFGFGSTPSVQAAPHPKPRECYVVGDADVFGLGAVSQEQAG